MGLLNEIGLRYNTDKSSRFHNYLDFYEMELPDRSFDGRLLEIGIMDGYSMQMWREYYPDAADIIGLDIMPKDHLDVPGVTMLQMNATDVAAMKLLGDFDIVVDDGSHMSLEQQQAFFWFYYNQLNAGGYYIIEDLWTSDMTAYINSEYTTKQVLDSLEHAGMDMKYFRYVHDGIEKIFPEYKGLDSETVIIRAGQ
jgi:23S rRNA U2552 (ribose-2'-O)-methylase RlmE/FtsJ